MAASVRNTDGAASSNSTGSGSISSTGDLLKPASSPGRRSLMSCEPGVRTPWLLIAWNCVLSDASSNSTWSGGMRTRFGACLAERFLRPRNGSGTGLDLPASSCQRRNLCLQLHGTLASLINHRRRSPPNEIGICQTGLGSAQLGLELLQFLLESRSFALTIRLGSSEARFRDARQNRQSGFAGERGA